MSQHVTKVVKSFVESPPRHRLAHEAPAWIRELQTCGHVYLEMDLLMVLDTNLHFAVRPELCTLREDMPIGGGSTQ